MQIKCPSCGALVPARDVNLDRMMGKCQSCNAVFPISPGARAQAVVRVPRPASITVEGAEPEGPSGLSYRSKAFGSARGTLKITRRWFELSAIFMLIFAVFWNGFLLFWYGIALSEPEPPILMLVFPLLHVAVGVYLAYKALSDLFNTTVITVDARTLTVRHGPLPWPGNKQLAVAGLRQLYVRRTWHRSKGGGYVRFAVAADDGGTAVDLLTGLGNEDEARFIEQTIEQHLSIEDDPSAGGA